ncbi:hypothetical protein GE21DRAFT_1052469 [Neurospora crassa]|nr:hypothetical protein GE21DRAFT_1052469 [Neurospora crassa]
MQPLQLPSGLECVGGRYSAILLGNIPVSCRITSCATIQIQLSKVTSSTPTTASLAPNCKYPARHQGLDAKIDSQLNCGGKNEGLTVRCDAVMRVKTLQTGRLS